MADFLYRFWHSVGRFLVALPMSDKSTKCPVAKRKGLQGLNIFDDRKALKMSAYEKQYLYPGLRGPHFGHDHLALHLPVEGDVTGGGLQTGRRPLQQLHGDPPLGGQVAVAARHGGQGVRRSHSGFQPVE